MVRNPVQWLRERPDVADALLALGLFVIGLAGLLTIDPTDTDQIDPDLLAVVLLAAACGPIALRRRYPVQAVWVSLTVTVVYWVRGYIDTAASFAVLLLVYSLAAHVDRPRSLKVGIAVGIILVGVMATGVVFDEDELPAIAVLANAVIFATAWTIGDSVRSRRAYLHEVEARVEQAEQDRELAAERAVHEERVRIARELHDVVAHSVSVMVVQAGAARRVLDRCPEQAAESMAVVETTGRNALDELRRVLGVLRAEDAGAATAPQPTAGDITTLVEQWRDAGLDVSLAVAGSPPPLSPGIGLTVYRVVQEALTNAYKHAGPAHVDVVLLYDADSGVVSIEVIDDGRGPVERWGVPSAGQGLIGMRERVELFGGELHVGPRTGGGFRVRATVPVGASTAA